jgi:hypothetical protein
VIIRFAKWIMTAILSVLSEYLYLTRLPLIKEFICFSTILILPQQLFSFEKDLESNSKVPQIGLKIFLLQRPIQHYLKNI